MDKVLADVSEYSRRVGRTSPDKLLEDLERERESLVQEKRDIEVKLSQVDDWKSEETSRILMRRLTKTRSIEQTTKLEAEVRKKKAPLIKDKQAVEKRLHDIKSRFARKQRGPSENTQVLLRIEQLLEQLVKQMASNR